MSLKAFLEKINVSDELKGKISNAKSKEELNKILQDEGFQLSDEELLGVVGGAYPTALNSQITDFTTK